MAWKTSYYHYDGQGSTQLLTDESGNVTDSYCNTAYGTPVDTGAANPTVNPFRFVGQLGYYLDADTGNYYVRVRTYAPVLAMWLSEDRLGFDSSNSDLTESYEWRARDWLTKLPNLYRYAENNPAAFIDASGLALQPTPFPGLPRLSPVPFPSPPVPSSPLPWLPPMPYSPSLPPEWWVPPSPLQPIWPFKPLTTPPKGCPLPWWWGDPYYDPESGLPGHTRPSQNPLGGPHPFPPVTGWYSIGVPCTPNRKLPQTTARLLLPVQKQYSWNVPGIEYCSYLADPACCPGNNPFRAGIQPGVRQIVSRFSITYPKGTTILLICTGAPNAQWCIRGAVLPRGLKMTVKTVRVSTGDCLPMLITPGEDYGSTC
jgi:RHS repeat-associated protein